MTQKTYQELRSECRALRAAHKKIKVERNTALHLLQKVITHPDWPGAERAGSYDLEQAIRATLGLQSL